MTQLYMILSAIGCERGQPIGLYYDIFKAQADFVAITDIGSTLTGNLTVFLVAYKVQKGGQLIELQELGRK